MSFTRARQLAAPRGAAIAVALCLTIASAGCASSQATGAPAPVSSGEPASPAAQPTLSRSELRTLAAAYLAIARPANERLDHAVDRFDDSQRDDLTAAAADLRSEAATERWFDRRLLKIPFPVAIKTVAAAMVQANDRRIELTSRQARSSSLGQLRSSTSRHKAADAAVEVDVRMIRRLLDLPPPSTS